MLKRGMAALVAVGVAAGLAVSVAAPASAEEPTPWTQGVLNFPTSDPGVYITATDAAGTVSFVDTTTGGGLFLAPGTYTLNHFVTDPALAVSFPSGNVYDVTPGSVTVVEYTVVRNGSLDLGASRIGATVAVTDAAGVVTYISTVEATTTYLPEGTYTASVVNDGSKMTLKFYEGNTFTIVGGQATSLPFRVVNFHAVR